MDTGADGADEDDVGIGEEDLLVVFRLSGRGVGSTSEQEAIDRLGDELAELVEGAGVGEYDGDEFGAGECTLFFCGPDAGRIMEVLRPVLRRHSLCRGGTFVRMVRGADGEFERRTDAI
ncbi:MAG: hypothetical protein RL398_580 [Planctomycetota bacterium]|jgi:hypothetical protein